MRNLRRMFRRFFRPLLCYTQSCQPLLVILDFPFTMLITLTTDFGSREGYPAAMKGVIYTIAPEARIVDITHEIRPQDLYETAFILEINVFYFPVSTVHVVVVDPGVGSARRAVAGQIGSQYFVAPDNGVLTRLLLRAERENWPVEFVHADQPAYWREDVSATFHGRDIFAPLGAHMAAGVPLNALGSPVHDMVRLPLRAPEAIPHGVRGEVIHIDHFGNAITNLTPAEVVPLGQGVQVELCGKTVTAAAT
jgi:S-adenosylmethionine hydrolase